MDSKKGVGLGGAAALVAAGGAVLLIVVPVLVVTLAGGGLMMGAAGLGALADEHLKSQAGSSQCLAPGAGGSYDVVTATQQEYVQTVIGVAKGLDIGTRGQIVAVMVMLQESGIQNYANSGKNVNGYDIPAAPGTDFWLDVAKLSMQLPHDAVGNDADSVGLFQQRPSAGWADTPGFTAKEHPKEAVKRLMNPVFAASAFFGAPGGVANQGLLDIAGWKSMGLAEAAQEVQGSAYPRAYRKWEDEARSLVSANAGAEKIAPKDIPLEGGDDLEVDTGSGGFLKDTFSMPLPEGSFTHTSSYGMRVNPVSHVYELHNGEDLAAPMGTPILAAADGTVAATGPSLRGNNWVVLNHNINGHLYSTVYSHMFVEDILVDVGDEVEAGDKIALVGMAGQTTGPHLHFGVWDGGRLEGGEPVDPMSVLDGTYTSPGGMGGGVTCGGGSSSSGGSGEGTGDTIESIIEAGKSQLGVDYSWGGGSLTGPSEGFGSGAGVVGYDCSSLMRYMVYQGTNQKLELPRTSRQQYQATKGNTVAKPGDGVDSLRPGDLLFYSNGGAEGIYHVAMYVGHGQVIQAPYSGLNVQIADANLGDSFYAATRIDFTEVSE